MALRYALWFPDGCDRYGGIPAASNDLAELYAVLLMIEEATGIYDRELGRLLTQEEIDGGL